MRELDLSPPADLAVIGVDDLPIAESSVPPLTTINYDRSGMAELLAAQVDAAILTGVVPAANFDGLVTLIERETT